MLAFRPMDTTPAFQASPASVRKNAAPIKHRSAAPTQPERADRAPPLAPSDNSGEGQDDDWHRLVERLPLQGMVRVLANNCAMIRREGNTFHLEMAPAHSSLRNSKLEERLQEALSAHLGERIKLQFTVTRPSEETPAAFQERVSQDRLRTAQEAIARDNQIKTIQEMFDARIVPDSIRPVD